MNSVKYAASNSKGTFAPLIGWIDYGPNFKISCGETKSVINQIPGGYTISFNVTYSLAPEILKDTIRSYPSPIFGLNDIPFGNTAYTGINGYVILYMPNTTPQGINTITTLKISNLIVRDSNFNRIEDFTLIAADAETTNKGEIWQATTDGTPWLLIDIMESFTKTEKYHPSITGIGTQTVTESGLPDINMPDVSSPVYLTHSPHHLTFNMTTNLSREGMALGIIINQPQSPQPTPYKIINICPNKKNCFYLSMCKDCLTDYYSIEFLNSSPCLNDSYESMNYKVWDGNLGKYIIQDSYICLHPKAHLYPLEYDILKLKVINSQKTYTLELCFLYQPKHCYYSPCH